MRRAVSEVLKNRQSPLRAVARKWGVSESTVRARVRSIRRGHAEEFIRGRPPALGRETEALMAKNIVHASDYGFPMTRQYFSARVAAVSSDMVAAGHAEVVLKGTRTHRKGFIKRNPEVAPRTATDTVGARLVKMNREAIYE